MIIFNAVIVRLSKKRESTSYNFKANLFTAFLCSWLVMGLFSLFVNFFELNYLEEVWGIIAFITAFANLILFKIFLHYK